MSFKCPQCAGGTFGSATLTDGTLRRFCNGVVPHVGTPCQFSWSEANDAKYGIAQPDATPVIGKELGPARIRAELTYFKEGGKYYTNGEYVSDARFYFDVVDELHELFAKGTRPGLNDNSSGGLGEFIALVQCKLDDGTDDVPHLITPASNADYMSKKPARAQLRLKLNTQV